MNKTLSNPTADLLNIVCSCFSGEGQVLGGWEPAHVHPHGPDGDGDQPGDGRVHDDKVLANGRSVDAEEEEDAEAKEHRVIVAVASIFVGVTRTNKESV